MSDQKYQKAILEEVKKFAYDDIYPKAAGFDQKEEMDDSLINKMASKGYLAASFPKEYGGLGLDPEHYGLFTEEIGKACCSTRSLITVHTSLVGETLIKWGTNSQKEKWLPKMVAGETIAAFALSEPDIGSNAKGIQTVFRKDGSNYIINGKKKWITFGDKAGLFLVFASDDKGVSAFLIERNSEGLTTTPMKGLLGNRASHVAEIEFNNATVSEENLVGKLNSGFSYIANTALDHGRYSIAWAGVAIAQAALDAMVTYSRQRSQFGQKLRTFQLIQGMIGDAVTKVHVARAQCLRVAELRKSNHPDAVIETMIAKYFTSKIALEVTTDAVQVHGGNGCCNSYPAERLFRESKILEIIEGTSQIQQEVIANFGLSRYYKKI